MPGSVEVPGTLSGHAAEIWRKAFLSAYDGTCADPDKRQVKDRDGCAAAVAWAAVKNDYRKNDQGEWVAKDAQATERSAGAEVAMSGEAYWVTRKDYSPEKRKEFADKGWALADGSYPIADKQDLMDAIHSFGRANESDRPRVKAHIMKRARQMGAEEMIPEEWGGKKEEKSMMVDEGYLARRAARDEANKTDEAVIESPRGREPAVRPEHLSSLTWNRLPLPMKTVGAVLFERVCWRTYEQAVEDAIYSGWDPVPNPSRAEEFIFRRWMEHPEKGRLLERSILVRKVGEAPWTLRSMSFGASQSLAVRVAPDEVRYNGPRITIRGRPEAPPEDPVPPEPVVEAVAA